MTAEQEVATDAGSPLPKKDTPRKRSKVSRACDSCRRKKIRCDAEYLSVLLRVTKICHNCTKNGDFCTFSRVPLKRGPSKGYIRDPADRADDPDANLSDPPDPHGPHHSVLSLTPPYLYAVQQQAPPPKLARPRLKLVGAPLASANGSSWPGPQPPAPPHLQPSLRRIPLSGPAGALSSTLHIVLPPLVGPQPPVALVPHHTGLASPTSAPAPEARDAKRILGPLWKVPYEMPPDRDAALGGSDNSGALGLGPASRRSSVDSMSSTLTAGSRSHIHSLKPLVSLSSDLLVSDSDDEFYPPRARGYSASLSPRNSVSSLLSLNGRISNQLTFNTPVVYGSQPPLPLGALLPVQRQLHRPLPATTPAFPLNTVEQNLSIYYAKFHASLAILPFNEALIQRVWATAQGAELARLLLFFSTALNNLVHYQYVSLENLTTLLHNLLLFYPLEAHPSALTYEALVTLFTSLLMVNYTIIMSGDAYSMGISMTAAVFNDYKVLEHFRALVTSPSTSLDPDDLRLHLPRLYLSLLAIDDCHSISFGSYTGLPDFFDLLSAHLDTLAPSSIAPSTFLQNMEIAKVFHELVISQRYSIFACENSRSKLPATIISARSKLSSQGFAGLFINLIKDRKELYDYLIEFSDYLKSVSSSSFDDDIAESIIEGQSKITRLVKKLSQSLLSFANYVSTVCSRPTNSLTTSSDLINPYLNVSYGQSFKLLKSCKLLIDMFLTRANDTESALKLGKLNQDLSIVYNLLVSNLNTNFNAISNAKNSFLQSYPGASFSLPALGDQLSLKNLGFVAINVIFKNLEALKLDLSNCPSPSENETVKQSSELLKLEILSSVSIITEKEKSEGWF